MEIKYDMSKNYWNCHNEAQSIVMMKRKLKKNPKRKIYGLFYTGIWYIIGTIISLILYLIFKQIGIESLFLSILLDLCIFLSVFSILYFIIIILTYLINKKTASHVGILKIKEDGLLDKSSSGKEVMIPWNQVELAVIYKYTVTFVTNTHLVVFVNIENKKEILKALQKYQKDLLVIDKSEGK